MKKLRYFDFITFSQDLNKKRLEKQVETGKNLSLRDIAYEIGCHHVLIHRGFSGMPLKVDALLTLLEWANLNINDYIRIGKR